MVFQNICREFSVVRGNKHQFVSGREHFDPVKISNSNSSNNKKHSQLIMNNAHKFKIPVHVEVNIRNDCTHSVSDVNNLVKDWLRHKVAVFFNGYITLDPDSASYAHSIKVVDLAAHKLVSFWQVSDNVFITVFYF